MDTRLQPRSRLLFWIATFGILALLVSSALSHAAESDRQFKRLNGTVKEQLPMGHREITVVLQLAGDPVAVVRSQSPDKTLLTSQQNAIENNLRVQQEALSSMIREVGGRVLGTYQYALNGIKVRGTPTQIANWARLPGVVAVRPVRLF